MTDFKLQRRMCIKCGRPLWDGGHAINDKECQGPCDEKCELLQYIIDQLIFMKTADKHHICERGTAWRQGFQRTIIETERKLLDKYGIVVP